MPTQTSFREDLGERRYDLDWVRIGAFMLLILYHVGMFYVTWDWHVKSPHASAAPEPLMMLSSPWRLSLLFLVSGVATGFLLARQGGKNFLGGRSIRLLIPLAFGMAVIVPPQSYLQVVEKLGFAGSYADFWRLYITGYHGFCRAQDCLLLPTWNHLWFVAYLWVYTVVLYVAVRAWPTLIPRLRGLAERRLSGVGILGWPIAYLCIIRLFLAGRFPANHALLGDWYNHALYFPVFVLGFALAGSRATSGAGSSGTSSARGAWAMLEQSRWPALGVAILGWAFLAVYFSAFNDDAAVPPEALKLFQRVVYGAEQWLAIACILGFAHRHLKMDGPARRYLTTAIFPVYILHQTVIVVLAHALQQANLYPPIEALLLVLVTLATCFLAYEVIRRIRPLQPLFGLAPDPAARAARTARRDLPGARPGAPNFNVPQDIN